MFHVGQLFSHSRGLQDPEENGVGIFKKSPPLVM